MHKLKECAAFILVLIAIGGTVWAILAYEASLAEKRDAIDLEAHPISTWSKTEIRVKKGETARIRILNRDTVSHGFAVPELDIEERIIHAGEIELVEFIPKYEGEFVFQCIVQCDRERHEFMTGKLIVEK